MQSKSAQRFLCFVFKMHHGSSNRVASEKEQVTIYDKLLCTI